MAYTETPVAVFCQLPAMFFVIDRKFSFLSGKQENFYKKTFHRHTLNYLTIYVFS